MASRTAAAEEDRTRLELIATDVRAAITTATYAVAYVTVAIVRYLIHGASEYHTVGHNLSHWHSIGTQYILGRDRIFPWLMLLHRGLADIIDTITGEDRRYLGGATRREAYLRMGRDMGSDWRRLDEGYDVHYRLYYQLVSYLRQVGGSSPLIAQDTLYNRPHTILSNTMVAALPQLQHAVMQLSGARQYLYNDRLRGVVTTSLYDDTTQSYIHNYSIVPAGFYDRISDAMDDLRELLRKIMYFDNMIGFPEAAWERHLTMHIVPDYQGQPAVDENGQPRIQLRLEHPQPPLDAAHREVIRTLDRQHELRMAAMRNRRATPEQTAAHLQREQEELAAAAAADAARLQQWQQAAAQEQQQERADAAMRMRRQRME